MNLWSNVLYIQAFNLIIYILDARANLTIKLPIACNVVDERNWFCFMEVGYINVDK